MILTLDRAAAFVVEAHARGHRVAFTTGAFDLLHPGHVRRLAAARAKGDLLLVGINSDRLTRAAKGPARPVTPENERAEIVASLAVVDAVVIIDDDVSQRVVDRLQPDVVITDAPVEQGWSTSAIIRKAQAVPAPAPPAPQAGR